MEERRKEFFFSVRKVRRRGRETFFFPSSSSSSSSPPFHLLLTVGIGVPRRDGPRKVVADFKHFDPGVDLGHSSAKSLQKPPSMNAPPRKVLKNVGSVKQGIMSLTAMLAMMSGMSAHLLVPWATLLSRFVERTSTWHAPGGKLRSLKDFFCPGGSRKNV